MAELYELKRQRKKNLMNQNSENTNNLSGPQFVTFFGPVLDALRSLGGSARPAEVRDHVAAALNIDESTQFKSLPSGKSRYGNRIAWARFYLAKANLIDSSRRGVWALTEKGRSTNFANHEEAIALFKEIHNLFHRKRPDTKLEETAIDEPEESELGHSATRDELMEVLQGLPADGFERFCQRLLRESGFQDVTVTGKSGDGGIDGIGILQVNALVSFKVLFQCKRYQGSVSASQVRDFRGAMMGRADKGIIITTGTFTSGSRSESVRDGVPPIELVDGEKLVDMLEELELGLRPVKAFEVDLAFFEGFSS